MSGGADGTVNLWEIRTTNNDDSYVIEKIFEYQIFYDQQIYFGVQSIQFRESDIIAGTQNGSIYKLDLPDHATVQTSLKESKDLITPIFSCSDSDEPLSCDFNYNNDLIFTITKNGILSIYKYNTLYIHYQFYFKLPTVAMHVFKTMPYFIICFENEFRMFNAINVQNDEISEESTFFRRYDLSINDMKVSFDEKILAVSIYINPKKNTQESPKIEIFSIDWDDKELNLVKIVDNLNSSIEFIDFSKENYFLLFKDMEKNISYVDLTDFKKIDYIDENLNIEWLNHGIKNTDIKAILDTYYNEENPIICLKKFSNKFYIATDYIGSIRIFEDDNSGIKSCDIYCQHLYNINNFTIANNRQIALSSSIYSKSIYIWKINCETNDDEYLKASAFMD